jgi:hypothetical protein
MPLGHWVRVTDENPSRSGEQNPSTQLTSQLTTLHPSMRMDPLSWSTVNTNTINISKTPAGRPMRPHICSTFYASLTYVSSWLRIGMPTLEVISSDTDL